MEILVIIALAFGGYKFFVWALDQRRQSENERVTKLEDEKYDRIVNCPTCEGTGECWMDHKHNTSDGFISDTPIRRVDIEKRMDENYKIHRPESHFSVDDYGTSYSYKKALCPHCNGTGTVYAKFETIPESKVSCQTCSGRGIITQTVKAEIGVNKVQVQCTSCSGSGKTIIQQIRKVHVKYLNQSESHTFNLASFVPPNFFDVSKPRF